jgi:hypothetical protein
MFMHVHVCALIQFRAQGFGAAAGSGSPGTRFSVELPLASDSPAELAALAADLMAALPAASTAGACIVCASEQVAAAVQAARSSSSSGRQGSGPVLSLRAACQTDSLSGPLLLLAPATSEVSAHLCMQELSSELLQTRAWR